MVEQRACHDSVRGVQGAMKTENRAGLSKITVYVKKETRADERSLRYSVIHRFPCIRQ